MALTGVRALFVDTNILVYATNSLTNCWCWRSRTSISTHRPGVGASWSPTSIC